MSMSNVTKSLKKNEGKSALCLTEREIHSTKTVTVGFLTEPENVLSFNLKFKSSWGIFFCHKCQLPKDYNMQYESHPDSLSQNLYPMLCNSFLALRLRIPESNSECHPSATADLVSPACVINLLNKFCLVIFIVVT